MDEQPTLTPAEAMKTAKKLLKNVYRDIDDEAVLSIAYCEDPKDIKRLLRDLKSFCNDLIKALK